MKARATKSSGAYRIPFAVVFGGAVLLLLARPTRELSVSIAALDVVVALSFLFSGFVVARRVPQGATRRIISAALFFSVLRVLLLGLLFLTLPSLTLPFLTLRAAIVWLVTALGMGFLGAFLGFREGFSTVFLYEARLLFRTPVTWAMLAGFALLTGASFLAHVSEASSAVGVATGSMGASIFIPTVQEQGKILLFLTPIIALRYTRANGSAYQALPVRPAEVLLGQFGASLLPAVFGAITPLLLPLSLGPAGRVPLLGALTAGLGLALLAAAACALGLFFAYVSQSSLGAGGLGLFLVLVISSAEEHVPSVVGRSLIGLLSLGSWLEPFSHGVLDARAVAYFVSLCVITLFATIRLEEMRRWA